MQWSTLIVFLVLFILVTVLGFAAAHWRKADLNMLHEWGLGGRRFGAWVTWFLLGGDVYTAYTLIAVPALVFGAGALGFFAVPYTIIVYPIVFAVLPRLWHVAHKHNYVTGADFVRGRYDSPLLGLLVAITGILATMPYIALQLVGMEVVISALGFPMSGWAADLPLLVAFVILAAFTYTSGLRAPALIAIIKDSLIYITVLAAVVIIPMQLGGFGKIFAAVPTAKVLLAAPVGQNLGMYSAFATLALGSALALFVYPHVLTGVLSAKNARTLTRNMAFLPAYTLVLGLVALLGFMALAAGVDKVPQYAPFFKQYANSFAVPALLMHSFPGWFVGVGFAAIVIGALVPAAIMSIAASNLWTRSIYRAYINPRCTDAQEASQAKLASLVVKFGALVFVLTLPATYAIQFQLLGGIWIIQILPALVFGLYTRWFHRYALALGWLAGMGVGTAIAAHLKFASSIYPLHAFGYAIPGYAALYSLILNIAVAAVLTVVLRLLGVTGGQDQTVPGDYRAQPGHGANDDQLAAPPTL
ncbi:MAG: monocarboxylate uptake permease MctP [Metallibacterium scheffleri]